MGSKTIIAIIIFIVIVSFIAIFLVARGVQKPRIAKQSENKKEVIPDQKRLITVADINHNPYVYEGLNAEVEASVSDWVSKKAFFISTVTGGGLLGTRRVEQILVINNKEFRLLPKIVPNELSLGENTSVNVKGKIRFINRSTLQELLGVPLDDELLRRENNGISEFEKGTVIILDSVTKI